MQTKTWAGIAASVAVLGLGVGTAVTVLKEDPRCGTSVVAGGSAAIGGPFSLVNEAGALVSETDVIDGMTLIYFGYTYCPDICPLDVQRNAIAVDIAAEMGVDVKPVFITIDPARDTPEVVGSFARNNHDKMIGLTGSPEQIKEASKAYKTFYRQNGEGEDYLMDHSVFSYLMTPAGFVDFFRRDMSPEDMAESMVCYAQT